MKVMTREELDRMLKVLQRTYNKGMHMMIVKIEILELRIALLENALMLSTAEAGNCNVAEIVTKMEGLIALIEERSKDLANLLQRSKN